MSSPIIQRPIVPSSVPTVDTSAITQPTVARGGNEASPTQVARGPLSNQFRSSPGAGGVFGSRATQIITNANLDPLAAQTCDRAAEYVGPNVSPEQLNAACLAAINGGRA